MQELSVFVVDDEQIVREYFAKVFSWSSVGMRWIGDAANGETALDECRALCPDLVMVDITMPGMDGIEFLHNLQMDLPRSHSVVLTCHQEFEYVRAALRLGAVDYIVKAATPPAEMVVALERIRDQILHGRRHQHERTPRRQWLAQLLLDGAPDQDTLRTGLSRMGLPLDEGHARVLLIQVEVAPRGDDMAVEPAGSKVDLEVDLERALDAVVTARGRAAWTPLRPGVWAVVGTLDPSCSDVDATREMADVVQRLQSQLDPNLIVSCGLSDLRADLAQAPLALADAEQALASRFYLGAGRLLTKQPAWSSISPELEAKLDQVAAMQRPADATFARHAGVLLGETCALCKEHWIDPEQARLLMIGMMQRLAATLRVDISPWDMALWPLQAAQAVTAQQLETWALQIIGVLTTSLEHYTMRPEIRKAVMHIRSCLSAPHDLNSAAKLAGLHPNYFSAVFHDETGQTFTEYLSRLRMERAAEYLREGAWKINQIAEMVGVPNYRTFFNMFHRVMGASPTEYKRRLDG